ncbi:hypothetical protein C491_11383 [Natronococcus amylolyticus DSM 10524]|uniref:DUF7979 domain-containing protein n=1 Tax=Natronococcus amylolyticus DSM 10524 TaxID=1227497 RepID=L9X5N3_9EURY|nr:hypothetical protein [Natronococcus amylolyticus]ELY57104.1 hypothetical protein C491_11383 [Natronococcus amylolyticus DSM 10524]
MATTTSAGRSLTLRRVDTVAPNAAVRHIDQLDDRTLERFYAALEGGRQLTATGTDLEPGTVIVATDYYRVEAV